METIQISKSVVDERAQDFLDLHSLSVGRAVRDADGLKWLGSVLANALNGILCNPQEAGQALCDGIENDHRTLQQIAISTLFHALYAYGDPEHAIWTDARNEAARNACQKFRELVDSGEVAVWFPLI